MEISEVFVFGWVSILIFFFFREQMSGGIRWATGQRSLGIWGAVQHVCVNSTASDSLQPPEL